MNTKLMHATVKAKHKEVYAATKNIQNIVATSSKINSKLIASAAKQASWQATHNAGRYLIFVKKGKSLEGFWLLINIS